MHSPQLAYSIRSLLTVFTNYSINSKKIWKSALYGASSGIFTIIELRLMINLLIGVANQQFTALSIVKFLGINEPSFAVDFIWNAFLVLIVHSIGSVLGYVADMKTERFIQQSEKSIRSQNFTKLLQSNKLYFDDHSFPEIIRTIHDDCRKASELIRSLYEVYKLFLLIIAYGIVLSFISIYSSVAIIVLGVVIFVSSSIFNKQFSHFAWEERVQQMKFATKIFEIVTNMTLVKAQTQSTNEYNRFNEISNLEIEHNVSSFKARVRFKKIQSLFTTSGMFILCAIILLQLHYSISSTQAILFLVLGYKFLPMISTLGEFVHTITSKVYALESLINISNLPKKYLDQPRGNKQFSQITKNITLQNLTFFYNPDRNILNKLSATIPANSITLLVGKTGSGKTTLLHLLMQLYTIPKHSIFVDGVDILTYSSDSIQNKIAYVSQDTFLFNDTVKNNAQYGIANISRAELEAAAKQSQLSDSIKNFPKKYNTLVGDKGVRLSGGECQRLSLMRALLKNAQILLLDEPSSALDVHTEKAIYKEILKIRAGKTIIICTHRLNALQFADHVIVMDDGEVIEQGAVKELMGKKGLLYTYAKEQELTLF